MTTEPLGPEETRDNFTFFHAIGLRFNDLDPYRHVNNARYYGFFDTAIMQFLVIQGGFNGIDGPIVPFTVENGCRFHAPVRFPGPVECGLRVARIGTSSVRYELGLFTRDSDSVSAAAYFVDVFVDAKTERPTPLPDDLRAYYESHTIQITTQEK